MREKILHFVHECVLGLWAPGVYKEHYLSMKQENSIFLGCWESHAEHPQLIPTYSLISSQTLY